MNIFLKKSKSKINSYIQTNRHQQLKEQIQRYKKMNSYQNQNPCQSGCNCNCGTRICLDQQLINQREQWKQKFICLQKQTTKDVGLLKERIYQECSTLMQAEFNKKEKMHADIVNKKNIDIQELTARVIKLQTAFKVSQKEKQVLKARLVEEQQRFNEKLDQVASIKQKHVKSLNNIQQINLSQTGVLKVRITQQHDQVVKRLQAQNEHLKHKVKQFQKKYQTIIPEVEKLKNLINKKTSQIQGLEQRLQTTKQTKDKQIITLKKKVQQAQQLHAPCFPKLSALNQKISDLQTQLTKAKLIKRQVKVEPVYVDRPVQVERVVQKIIEVERIVKQYLQPQFDYKQYEQENKKLRLQLQNIIRELHQFENRYEQMIKQNDQTVNQYEQNILKYKTERDTLAKRINQQDEQLEKIYRMIENQSNQPIYESNPQRIVVQVNKDGTVNKRIQKIDIQQRVNVQTTIPNLKAVRQTQNEQQMKGKTVQNQRVTRTVTQTANKNR